MASEQPVVASGAEYESATRRRNVGTPATNTLVVDKVEIDDKKKQVKKVCMAGNGSEVLEHWDCR